MNALTYVVIALAPFALVGFIGFVAAGWRTYKHLRMRKVRAHPMAMRPGRNSPNAQGLLDEPPAECPTCTTTMVVVARSPFTPNGELYSLPNVEHFKCENGHTWQGPNQERALMHRLAVRKGLKDVPADAATAPVLRAAKLEAVKPPADADALKAKVEELKKACAVCEDKPEVDSTES